MASYKDWTEIEKPGELLLRTILKLQKESFPLKENINKQIFEFYINVIAKKTKKDFFISTVQEI